MQGQIKIENLQPPLQVLKDLYNKDMKSFGEHSLIQHDVLVYLNE